MGSSYGAGPERAGRRSRATHSGATRSRTTRSRTTRSQGMAALALGATLVMTGCSVHTGTATALRVPPGAAVGAGAASRRSGVGPSIHGGPLDPTPPPVAADWYGQAGDGRWVDAGRNVGVEAAVQTTTLRQGGHVVSAAWIAAASTRVVLYAGTTQPRGTWTNDGAVPTAAQSELVAAFNSGFQLDASQGGWYADGRPATPLREGAASLVIRADGSATVGEWGRDVSLTPDVVAVRQNLDLLVDAGAPTPLAGTARPIAVWGDPLHEQVLTWRSALGVDASGDLLYMAGPDLDPPTLAAAMVAVGAVRAMELDINPEWVSFDTFTGGGATVTGTKLLSSMYFPPTHFLYPFWRDFVAVFAR